MSGGQIAIATSLSTVDRGGDVAAAHRRPHKRAGVGSSDCRRLTLGEWLMLGVPTLGTREVVPRGAPPPASERCPPWLRVPPVLDDAPPLFACGDQ